MKGMENQLVYKATWKTWITLSMTALVILQVYVVRFYFSSCNVFFMIVYINCLEASCMANHFFFFFLFNFREAREQGEDEIFVRRVHGRSSRFALTQKEARFLGWCGIGGTHV